MWRAIKIALCVAGGLFAILIPPSPADFADLSWGQLPLIPILSMVLLLAVTGIQAWNPWSAPEWARPGWSSSPFDPGQPLAWFHLGGWFFIASSIGLLLSARPEQVLPAFAFLGVGLGALAGVRVAEVIFRRKFKPSDKGEDHGRAAQQGDAADGGQRSSGASRPQE
jgi:hypothetical protein